MNKRNSICNQPNDDIFSMRTQFESPMQQQQTQELLKETFSEVKKNYYPKTELEICNQTQQDFNNVHCFNTQSLQLIDVTMEVGLDNNHFGNISMHPDEFDFKHLRSASTQSKDFVDFTLSQVDWSSIEIGDIQQTSPNYYQVLDIQQKTGIIAKQTNLINIHELIESSKQQTSQIILKHSNSAGLSKFEQNQHPIHRKVSQETTDTISSHKNYVKYYPQPQDQKIQVASSVPQISGKKVIQNDSSKEEDEFKVFQSPQDLGIFDKTNIIISSPTANIVEKKTKYNKKSSSSNMISKESASKNKRKTKCKHCGKQFEKAEALGGHMSKAHPKQSPSYMQKFKTRINRTEDRELLEKAKELYAQRYSERWFNYRKLASIKEELRNQLLTNQK